MAKTKAPAPRITAGPITDLGVDLEGVVKFGFVSVRSFSGADDRPIRDVLFMESQDGFRKIKHNIDEKEGKEPTYLESIRRYLEENNMYIAHAQTATFIHLSGDLYQSKSSEE